MFVMIEAELNAETKAEAARVCAVESAPDIEVWEPTMELRTRVVHNTCGGGSSITEQKFVRVSGGDGSTKWRPLPMVDFYGHPQ